ncbi:hypothetical protein AB0H88_12380 [Nonomuraea sp. NPDC050680]|uniref:hypothetical protein n=1 Tax=Nonomuraea sp. NPDC050680 TaxID=3154630 RepID=UPI0033EE68F6
MAIRIRDELGVLFEDEDFALRSAGCVGRNPRIRQQCLFISGAAGLRHRARTAGGLGATLSNVLLVGGLPDYYAVTLHDPEGNEFCISSDHKAPAIANAHNDQIAEELAWISSGG